METIGRTAGGWQLVIEDSDFLSGRSVARMLRLLARLVGASVIASRDIEGGGEVLSQLVPDDSRLRLWEVDTVIALAEGMIQFDWGDFFFLRSEKDAMTLQAEDGVASLVQESDVTLRCVDDRYFYIYGADRSLRKELKACLQVREEKEGVIASLDFPA